MSWYDEVSAGIVALGGAATVVIVGLVNQLLKTRRTLAQQNSEIKVEKSEANGSTWLNERLMAQVVRAEAARDATIVAAKELFDQREAHVEKIARLEEKLANSERESVACQDRAARAEGRAAVAEEHMRKQAEQILVMSLTIDGLTTELTKHDPEAAKRLTPKARQQPLLDSPTEQA